MRCGTCECLRSSENGKTALDGPVSVYAGTWRDGGVDFNIDLDVLMSNSGNGDDRDGNRSNSGFSLDCCSSFSCRNCSSDGVSSRCDRCGSVSWLRCGRFFAGE
jgi:hypothetical protein